MEDSEVIFLLKYKQIKLINELIIEKIGVLEYSDRKDDNDMLKCLTAIYKILNTKSYSTNDSKYRDDKLKMLVNKTNRKWLKKQTSQRIHKIPVSEYIIL